LASLFVAEEQSITAPLSLCSMAFRPFPETCYVCLVFWLRASKSACKYPTNMEALKNEKCTACRRDSPRVTETEIVELKLLIPEWTLVERDGIQRLERVFRFSNFVEALNFSNRVGAIAEEEGHHPAILTEWGRVTVTLWTHKIRGLHRNDFIMAAKLDAL
jgi:4a-hydroxytetrahydrobiopterin dehydratase